MRAIDLDDLDPTGYPLSRRTIPRSPKCVPYPQCLSPMRVKLLSGLDLLGIWLHLCLGRTMVAILQRIPWRLD